MKERIFNNWKTTALGIILLVLSIVLLCIRAITMGEFSGFFPTILGLLYVRDTFLKITNRL